MLALWAGWRGALRLLHRGPAGRLLWEADGRWRFESGSQPGAYVQPGPIRRLGPIVWISWPGVGSGRNFHADGLCVEPKALAALQARVKFNGPVSHRRSP